MKIESVLATAVIAAVPLIVQAQKASQPFLRIGNDVTTFGEFDRMYRQNNDAALIPMTESEYATLFTGYKLKVAEARAMRLDTLHSYQDECRAYEDDLAKPYLEDTLAFSGICARERERQKIEVRAEHILISVRPNALPVDTLKAYEKALSLRKRVLNGEDFGKIADMFSDDPSVKSNHGDLGYFSALQMVSQFEDVAFSLNVGEVSDVFRTRYGYHFIKLTDRRETEGQVSVRHIMKIVPSGSNDEEAGLIAKAQIDSLYALATADGADFAALAAENSDDRQSAMRGGIIPWFSRSQILPEFADAAFALAKDGDLSRPVRTRAGWHIIMRVGRRTAMPDSEFKHLMERAQSNVDAYKNANVEARMAKLAAEYGFQWNAAGLDTLVGRSLRAGSTSRRIAALQDSAIALATIDGNAITLADVAKDALLWRSDALPSENVARFFCNIVRNYERSRLEVKYPEFAYARKEYAEGLLVFEIMQRKVWGVAPDSSMVDSLFAANPARYSKGGVFDGCILFCRSPKVAAKVRTLLSKGKVEKAKSLAYSVVDGPIAQGGVYDDFVWPIMPVSEYVVVFGKVSNGSQMRIEECRGNIVADCLMLNDKRLIEQLRVKYAPEQLLKIKDK